MQIFAEFKGTGTRNRTETFWQKYNISRSKNERNSKVGTGLVFKLIGWTSDWAVLYCHFLRGYSEKILEKFNLFEISVQFLRGSQYFWEFNFLWLTFCFLLVNKEMGWIVNPNSSSLKVTTFMGDPLTFSKNALAVLLIRDVYPRPGFTIFSVPYLGFWTQQTKSFNIDGFSF